MENKNGQIRCCIDSPTSTKACSKDEFPLPNIYMLVDAIARHSMLSCMDDFNGHKPIMMHHSLQEKSDNRQTYTYRRISVTLDTKSRRNRPKNIYRRNISVGPGKIIVDDHTEIMEGKFGAKGSCTNKYIPLL